MARIRVIFDSPQTFDAITVTEMTVEADQVVLLNGGTPVLNVAADAVRSLEGAGGGRLARLRAKHPNHGKPWTAEEDAELTRRWNEGVSAADLSEHFGRSRGAVRAAALRLRLPER
ncbi:hypothetical protein E1287_36685 [Actinomadura sp. KC06]|uniref:hypothetical protein n=1 Tax=Actinomadura sp. KC06 TaxID=2530369 RepID=UPI00104E56E7|nr:hypothetical protein [Actinomadura sp. KC06]TDD26102.1 hypothetical protein E1287_36685 [Actinomadura sp. KC06]